MAVELFEPGKQRLRDVIGFPLVDADIAVGANINADKIGTGVVDNTEFDRLNGLTSAIEEQGNKGAVSGYAGLDASQKLLVTNLPGVVVRTDQTNTFGDFDQIFKDNRILIESPDGLTPITLVNLQQTAARNLTIPILTANDTIAVKGLDNAFSVGQTITGDVDVTGNVSVSGINRIELGGAGSDTYWREGAANRAELWVGGVEQIRVVTGQMTINLPTGIVDTDSKVTFFTIRSDTGVVGNTISNLQHRGDDAADVSVLYAQTLTLIRDPTPGSVNGSYQIRVAENAPSNISDKTLYMEFHGLNANIAVFRDLAMSADILMGQNFIRNAEEISFNSAETTRIYGSITDQRMFFDANGVNVFQLADFGSRFLRDTEIQRTGAEPRFFTNRIEIVADDTAIGKFDFAGQDDGGAGHTYATVESLVRTDVADSEAGSLTLGVSEAGTPNVPYLDMNGLTLQIDILKDLDIANAKNIIFGTTTGTKFGTAADQKIGKWGVTPVVQPAHIIDADGTLADITTKFNTLLAQHATTGEQAAS